MTPLDKTIKRSLTIKGAELVVTLTPQSVKLTQKGRRNGVELAWEALLNGESALAVALQASVGRFETEAEPAARNEAPPARKKTKQRDVARASGAKSRQA